MNAYNSITIYQPEFFKLLSDCYILPDIKLRDSVYSLFHMVKSVYPHLRDDAETMRDVLEQATTLEDLQVDFTKLFIGPYTMLAPPYESIYRNGEGTMMGESTLEILRLYKESGHDLTDNYCDAPDHIATELEFLYILFAKAVSQELFDEADASAKIEEILQLLLVDHLSQWIPELTQRMEEKAESDFYKALARITRDVIKQISDHYMIS